VDQTKGLTICSMNDQFDVAILGAGFEGGMLATILAYKGAKVVLIDAGTHPRFALGESTVRHTFRMIKIMAERFGVPEFKTEFNSGEQLHKHVSAGFGVKKNFGFVYHRAGQHQKPEEATQLVIPPYREGYEAHLFRQDTDAYLTYTAIHHGATVKYKTFVKEVETDQQGVTIKTDKGETIRAKLRRRCVRRGPCARPHVEPARRSAACPAADPLPVHPHDRR
jgi:FADH2 O2-dependent halogenase